MIKFSIVVCTFNRCNLFQKCLVNLISYLNYEMNSFEIIIVNNNSSDDTEKVSYEFANKFRFVRYYLERNPGLSNARNLGLEKSKGEYIIYLDDDALIREDFYSRIEFVASNFSFSAWGGIDMPFYSEIKPSWVRDKYYFSRLPYKKVSQIKSKNLFISGFCMVFKRSVLKEIGGFNNKLGMNGNTIAYGEETNVQILIKNRGYQIGYDPFLKVDHFVHDYKLNLTWFFKSAFATGRDWIITYDLKKSNLEIMRNLLLGLGLTFISIPFNLLKFIFRGDYYIENFLIEVFKKLIKRLSIVYHFFQLNK